MLHRIFDLLAPPSCASCDLELAAKRPVLFCAGCAATVERAPLGSAAAFLYGGAVAEAITRMKYGDRADLASRLGAALASADVIARLRGRIDAVVPVPLHAARLAERGYNQSTLLAIPVARALGVPIRPRVLVRTTHTPRQAGLDRAARLTNVRGAFRVCDRRLFSARVALIDDVRTTGATLTACAEALTSAGVREVAPVVLAVRDDELHGARAEAL